MDDERYLWVRVGAYAVWVPAELVVRVWPRHDAGPRPDDAPGRDAAPTTGAEERTLESHSAGVVPTLDWRALFGVDASLPGVRLALELADAGRVVAEVDRVARVHRLSSDAFHALPGAFRAASQWFDAVGATPHEGVLGLRLRRQPRFDALARGASRRGAG
jgi:hypothetical protein